MIWCAVRGEGRRRTVRSMSMSAMMYTPLLSMTNRMEVMIWSRVIASALNVIGAAAVLTAARQ